MQRCERRGIPIYRFNSEDYPAVLGLTYDPGHPADAVVRPHDGGPVAIGKARGIWLRRPQWPTISETVTDPIDRRLAMQEAIAAIGGLWRLLRHKCVSDPDALQAARWKLPQLQTAASLGLKVPESVITSCEAPAAAFLDAWPGSHKGRAGGVCTGRWPSSSWLRPSCHSC